MGTDNVAGAIFDLLAAVGLPTRLKDLGFDAGDIPAAARITAETDNGLNPGPVTEDAVRGILQAAYDGLRPD